MASVNRSTNTAVTPSVSSVTGNLVNVAAGSPAQEKYPGAVNPTEYINPGPGYPVAGPVAGDWGQYFGVNTPPASSGGGVVDATYLEGNDAPMVAWDSSAGAPFAPSGPVNPALHAQDLGAVYVHQHETPAFIGDLRREIPTGQTYNREYAFDPVTGQNVPQPNNRVDFDQIQSWDPSPGDGGGYAPWDPGYAERPVLLNVAYQATAVTSEHNQYGVNGILPDRAPFNSYSATSYESPADPVVSQPAPAQSVPSSGGWLLG